MASNMPSVPQMRNAESGNLFQSMNVFLDKHVLPYPVKYLTNRLTILATMCLLIPLIFFANNQVFVLATNSYLNVMSVVVSSTVLLYSSLAEARDRAAAERREEIAQKQRELAERRAEQDHELIQSIKTELTQHVTASLDNIQKILIDYLEKLQDEDEARDVETQQAVRASADAHRKALARLREMVEGMQKE